LKNKIIDKIGNFLKREDEYIDICSFNFKYHENNQTQVNFIEQDSSNYPNLVYSYSFENQKFDNCSRSSTVKSSYRCKIDYNVKNVTSKNEYRMKKSNLFTTDRWIKYEATNGVQTANDLLDLISNNVKNISKLRKRPVIAYITAINSNQKPDQININDGDIEEFVSLMAEIDTKEEEIDVILHSNGGYLQSVHKIIELLRSRFKIVNFLIPLKAYSAASMMCMSADEIVMTPESSLSPFDVQILSPDDNEIYLPSNLMRKSAREAKRALNPFCVFMPKLLYKNWTWNMVQQTNLLCDISDKNNLNYSLYYLLKYKFKEKAFLNKDFSQAVNMLSYYKLFTSNGRKAYKITQFFIKLGIDISHSTPIMCNGVKNIGLNTVVADDELLEQLRETYQLSKVLFQRSIISKLYVSTEKNFYTYNKTMDEK